ncbi:MAG: HAMP domain-containing sensor histidine kinase [Candidatus Omnitrophota bacterium]
MSKRDKEHENNDEFALILQEIGVNPFNRLHQIFALMSIIPFLTFMYILVAILFGFEILVGYVGLVIFFAFIVSLCGLLLGYRFIRGLMNKVMFYAARSRRCSELKSNFVATVAHEFRDPLYRLSSNIKGMLDMEAIKEKVELSAPMKICDIVTERMSDLVMDLVDLYKINAQLLNVARKKSDIIVLLKDVLGDVLAEEKKKHVNLREQILVDSVNVMADEDKMKQAIRNLLMNTIKYTPEGGQATVKVSQVGEFVRMEFCDSGEQIPAQLMEEIFDKFERFEHRTDQVSFDLALAKDIIELHEGRIWAENLPETGNRFIVVIPLV